MKTNASSRSAAFALRAAIGVALCWTGTGLASASDQIEIGSCAPAPPGLISWWPGDKDDTDVQGDNSGTLTNGASYAPGFVSRAAFSFDGSQQPVVQVGSSSTLKMTTAMTMEGWIYPTLIQNGVIANREGEYQFFLESTGDLSWAFANADPGWVSIPTGFFPPKNSWTYVAVTYDNGLITTYANGVQVHQYHGSGSIGDVLPAFNDFRIGNRQQFPVPFAGRIDEVKIYNRALTSDEVAAIYAAGSSGNCKPVVFVADLTAYAIPKVDGEYKVGTTIQVIDAEGHAVSEAVVRVTVTLPDGTSISDAVTTDLLGNTDFSIFSSQHGTYTFKVERVIKLGRQYGGARNVETRARITIL